MKNINNKLKIALIALLTISVSSCDEILDDDLTDFGNGPDFVGFSQASVTAPFVVEDEPQTYQYNIPISLDGPNSEFAEDEIVVTFEIDPSSTAEVGSNYEFSAGNTVTLNRENDYSANIPVTVLTEGVAPPTVESLILNITDISNSGSSNVVINEKNQSTRVNLSYICPADLSGKYIITNSVCDVASPFNEATIEADGDGGWLISRADGALLNGCTSNTSLGQPGNIIVVCGEVEVATQPPFCDSNGIGCITGGAWDEETGILTLTLNDSFFGFGDYTATYTRVE